MAKLRYWVPTLLWMALIFYLSSRPTTVASVIDWQDFFIKKTAHFIEYFILATLIYQSLRHTTTLSLTSRLTIALLATVLYAASDEFHQTFIPGRSGHPRDVAIDTAGAIVALLLHRQRAINTTG